MGFEFHPPHMSPLRSRGIPKATKSTETIFFIQPTLHYAAEKTGLGFRKPQSSEEGWKGPRHRALTVHTADSGIPYGSTEPCQEKELVLSIAWCGLKGKKISFDVKRKVISLRGNFWCDYQQEIWRCQQRAEKKWGMEPLSLKFTLESGSQGP